ncbi:hypothetical protein CEXT_36763 [Caerostris extrusa]|uniref:Uncharacterized protein n=1 Tax=Caerostris extrusa TaxID=172846 RepID=A0AAV4XG00_CAEEX|nr:hypothetical protein CEXT_36763 [Caerostris extrusa]
MATEGRGKRQSVCYKYNVAQSTLSEGVSVTLKEMSMQMADDAERLRMYALLTCIITQWCSTSSLALLLLRPQIAQLDMHLLFSEDIRKELLSK